VWTVPEKQPNVGDLFAGRTTLDLEHGARERAIDCALGRRQQLGDAGNQRVRAGPGEWLEPKKTGMHQPRRSAA